MEYKALDIDSICDYLKNIKEIQELFGDDELEAKEIGDGNLNFVYLVSSANDSNKAVIAKQAVPYLRVIGEEFPLGRERMNYEIRALVEFKKLAPDYIPDIYYTSEDMSLLVMQYLGNHVIFRTGLLDGKIYPNFAEHISSYLAETLFHTSSLSLQSVEKRALIDKFNSNTELCKLTEDFVFTFAYMEHETNDNDNAKGNVLAEQIYADMEFKQRVLELKYKFMNQTDALLHGDLHTGSIMLNADETYVIDPEFAFVGPFGFDIGALLSNLVQNYIHHSVVTQNTDMQEWLLSVIRSTLEKFENKFLELWDKTSDSSLIIDGFLDGDARKSYQHEFMTSILNDTVGFAGCKMARRIFGVAGVADIRGIEDAELRAKAEEKVFDIARVFVTKFDSIDSVEQIIDIIKGV